MVHHVVAVHVRSGGSGDGRVGVVDVAVALLSHARAKSSGSSILGLDVSGSGTRGNSLILIKMKIISLEGLGTWNLHSGEWLVAEDLEFSDVRTFFFTSMPGRMVLTRLRLLMTSVLRDIGRGRPCSLRNKPQALQRT